MDTTRASSFRSIGFVLEQSGNQSQAPDDTSPMVVSDPRFDLVCVCYGGFGHFPAFLRVHVRPVSSNRHVLGHTGYRSQALTETNPMAVLVPIFDLVYSCAGPFLPLPAFFEKQAFASRRTSSVSNKRHPLLMSSFKAQVIP